MRTKAVFSRLASRLGLRADEWQPNGTLDVGDFAQNVDRIRFRHSVEDIEGWLSPREQRILYALGRYAPGPILEIGPFAGRSTICIALGIRDSGVQKDFVTIDRFPELENFRSHPDGVALFEPKDAESPFAVLPRDMYERDFKPVLSKPGGMLGTLNRNLARHGVDALVKIEKGDFRDMRSEPYALVFCDALHDKREIDMNAPSLRRLIRPGSIVAFHDFSSENELEVRRHLSLGDSFISDLLFVADVV